MTEHRRRDSTSTIHPLTLIAVVLLAIVIATLCGPTPTADAHTSTCPTIRPPMTVKYRAATLHQRRMATRILNVGRRHRASWKVHLSAIVAATQESAIRNIPYGHGTSVGLFQLIDVHEPSTPGTQRLNPEWVSHWYYTRAINIAYHRPSLTAPQIAQAVQRSAYPRAYERWLAEAKRTYKRYAVTCGGAR